MRARTTSQFLSEFGVQVAINGGFFAPFNEKSLLSVVPFIQGRKEVIGGAASSGIQYGQPSRYYPMLNVSADNHATIGFCAAAALVHGNRRKRSIHRPWKADLPVRRQTRGLDDGRHRSQRINSISGGCGWWSGALQRRP